MDPVHVRLRCVSLREEGNEHSFRRRRRCSGDVADACRPLNGGLRQRCLRSSARSDFLILLTICRINRGAGRSRQTTGPPGRRRGTTQCGQAGGAARARYRWMRLDIQMIFDAPAGSVHGWLAPLVIVA